MLRRGDESCGERVMRGRVLHGDRVVLIWADSGWCDRFSAIIFGFRVLLARDAPVTHPWLARLVRDSSVTPCLNPGAEYFSGPHAYSDGFFQLYVLITTANYPDVMMPAYDFSRITSLLFVLFLLVGMYVFLSIVLAVVYHNYQNYMKLETRTMLQVRPLRHH